MNYEQRVAALLSCPRFRAAVRADTDAYRRQLMGAPIAAPPAPRSTRRGSRLALVLAAGLLLAGCRVTLYSVEWDSAPRTVPVEHNAAGGYVPACGDLPGVYGDDC